MHDHLFYQSDNFYNFYPVHWPLQKEQHLFIQETCSLNLSGVVHFYKYKTSFDKKIISTSIVAFLSEQTN